MFLTHEDLINIACVRTIWVTQDPIIVRAQSGATAKWAPWSRSLWGKTLPPLLSTWRWLYEKGTCGHLRAESHPHYTFCAFPSFHIRMFPQTPVGMRWKFKSTGPGKFRHLSTRSRQRHWTSKSIQYFGHQMQKANSLEKTLMLGKIEGKRRRERQRMR